MRMVRKVTTTEEGELTTECDKVSRLTRHNQHLEITRQNEGDEKSNLSQSSKDDAMNTKDDRKNCKREAAILRPESWRRKLGGDKKGDHNLEMLTIIVIGVILGITTYSFKSSHTPWSVSSQDLTNKNLSTHQTSLGEQKQAF